MGLQWLAGLLPILLCCAALAGGCSSSAPLGAFPLEEDREAIALAPLSELAPLSAFPPEGDREAIAFGEDDDDGGDACGESPAQAARRAETEAIDRSIRHNAQLAREICGELNVLEVSLEGFECHRR